MHYHQFTRIIIILCMAGAFSTQHLTAAEEEESKNTHAFNIRVQALPFNLISPKIESSTVQVELLGEQLESLALGIVSRFHRLKSSNKASHTYSFNDQTVGLRTDLMLGHGVFNDGYYISSALLFGNFTSQERNIDEGSCLSQYTNKGFIWNHFTTVGKQWIWKNGLNIQTGLGYMLSRPFKPQPSIENPCISKSTKIEDHGNYNKLFIEFAIGFAFEHPVNFFRRAQGGF